MPAVTFLPVDRRFLRFYFVVLKRRQVVCALLLSGPLPPPNPYSKCNSYINIFWNIPHNFSKATIMRLQEKKSENSRPFFLSANSFVTIFLKLCFWKTVMYLAVYFSFCFHTHVHWSRIFAEVAVFHVIFTNLEQWFCSNRKTHSL